MAEPLEKVRHDLIEEAVEKLLETDEYYQSQATDLITADQLKARHRQELRESLQAKEQKDSIVRGFDLIKQDIIEVLEEEQLESFYQDMAKVNKESLEKVPEKLNGLLKGGDEMVTFQDLFGLGNETLRIVYALGYQYLEKEMYENARDVFTVVTTFNPYIADFWNATALCYQAMKEFEKAVNAFSVACAINTDGVISHVSRAECCIELNRLSEAGEDLETAMQIVEANPALDEEWGAYLKNLKDNL